MVMTGLVIGSSAIKSWFPEFPREVNDFDAWTPSQREWLRDDISDLFWDERLEQWLKPTSNGSLMRLATPDELYTIKVSHSPWELKNGSWRKHMHDLVWLQDLGAAFLPDLYKILYPIWEGLHGKKPVNLNLESSAVLDMQSGMSQRGFFQDAVVRKYDHDSLHYSVAYDPGHPIYEDVLKDGKSVAMDMKKVWALPYARQVALFREEVYATALERWVIPSDYDISPSLAYHWALKKTITSLTKGDSALFMIRNYRVFRDADLDDQGRTYVQRHLDNLKYLIPLEN